MAIGSNFIEAEGMDSQKPEDGEGGGGAVYVLDLCWHRTFFNNKNGLPIPQIASSEKIQM